MFSYCYLKEKEEIDRMDKVKIDYNVDKTLPFNTALALGAIDGISAIYKFAFNSDIDIVEEAVWDVGGNYIFLDSAEYISIVSTSDNDKENGGGQDTIMVIGLGEFGEPLSVVVKLNGTTPVLTTKKFYRVFIMRSIKSEEQDVLIGSNIGDITATSVDTSNIQARIVAGNGSTQMAVFSVPKGYTALIRNVDVNCGKNDELDVYLKIRTASDVGEYQSGFITMAKRRIYQNNFIRNYVVERKMGELTDMILTAKSEISNGKMSSSLEVVLFEGVYDVDTPFDVKE